MPPRTVTTARQRRLGAELRRLREAAGHNSREAAALLGIDHTKISQMETARFGVSGDRIRALACVYGCDDQQYIEALIKIAEERTKGWWVEYQGMLPADFLDIAELEHYCRGLRTYQIAHIPGLLQTEDHIKAIFSETDPPLLGIDLDRRINHRARRQVILEKEWPPNYEAVIHESALRMQFGGRKVARDQLKHLLSMSERDHITIHVIPFAAGGFAGSGQSIFYAQGDVAELDTVQLDATHGVAFLDSPAQLRNYRRLLDRMRAKALSATESSDFIHSIARQL
ncbi:helix-turn-helix domain-containing protein [Streptomyces sp. DT24]|uniref:helix-turn-helix domain-containing protein n=1 Tax=unclassified Streptomyces TaxID=2593676 RepID=UPI0023B8C8F5|nr:helix-turn-helix transcriptional regulator [Streptomyces sp. AM 4-1-1]WEH34235.1 helix-turn-helix transcriptional regulator [Streptomyces sp. AM 4-1-1]